MGRCYLHDYKGRCIYHITLSKAGEIPAFGHLCGHFPDSVIVRSRLGAVIEKNIRRMGSFDSALRVLQYCIMPDHVHLLIFVTAPLSRHLGAYISMLKVRIHQDYRQISGEALTVFEKDFYDCILRPSRSLDTIYRYIRENPRRMAVRREHPEFFRRVNALRIGDSTYNAYGNFQLLDCPFKEQVIIHRKDSPETRRLNREKWIYTGSNGGVLVSPFISASEKTIRDEAESVGARFIHIVGQPMEERYKPAGREFRLCEEGRLLIISAGLPGPLTRPVCLTMNALANQITEGC
ncbi:MULTISPECIES: transposase [Muribaculum]|uniref:transposase n=1 Tax=Muribaculum TaxID=1918540 RepID=UPI0031BAAFFB